MNKRIEITLPTGRERLLVLESMYTENLSSEIKELLFNNKLYIEIKSGESLSIWDLLKVDSSAEPVRIDEINTDFGKAEAVITFDDKYLDIVNKCILIPNVIIDNNKMKLISLVMVNANDYATGKINTNVLNVRPEFMFKRTSIDTHKKEYNILNK